MPSKLSLYNEACRIIGERKLASLTEARKARYDLDTVWDAGGVKACLELSRWNFARRTARLDYSASVAPTFGFRRAFQHPEDWVRTVSIAVDESFSNVLTSLHYRDEASHWFCDFDVLYVSYVSDDDAYGMDLSKWSQSFFDTVALHFADKICMSVSKDKELSDTVFRRANKARVDARGIDAQNGPTEVQPIGAWSRARIGGRTNERGRELTGDGDLY